MLGFAYASVPLYRLFCQKTGFAGTPRVVKAIPKKSSSKTIRVQFVANTNRDLPWVFYPLQNEITLKIGESSMAYYYAENKSSEPIIGMATYNVSPDKAGYYFNKIHCFCFEQQLLKPGEKMQMPLLFFIDPDFLDDPLTKDLPIITLSYTFFRYKK